jgi:hypothetical protein
MEQSTGLSRIRLLSVCSKLLKKCRFFTMPGLLVIGGDAGNLAELATAPGISASRHRVASGS